MSLLMEIPRADGTTLRIESCDTCVYIPQVHKLEHPWLFGVCIAFLAISVVLVIRGDNRTRSVLNAITFGINAYVFWRLR